MFITFSFINCLSSANTAAAQREDTEEFTDFGVRLGWLLEMARAAGKR
jgi:hypothetical protein